MITVISYDLTLAPTIIITVAMPVIPALAMPKKNDQPSLKFSSDLTNLSFQIVTLAQKHTPENI